MKKKVIISGGGTGGHIFPALSIANALKKIDNDIDILFVGAEGKMEMERIPANGYKIIGLPVRGLVRGSIFKNFQVIANLMKSVKICSNIINDFKPDVIVGVGGYASGPIGIRGVMKKVPVVLQEQNSYAGMTNKLIGKYARRICVAYDNMDRFFPAEKIIKTGNPVRANLLSDMINLEEAYSFYGLDSSKKTIVVTGGSLGARSINNAIVDMAERIAKRDDIQLLWQCGKYYFDKLKDSFDGKYANIKLVPFLERMDYVYAISDIIIARAGASTISELAVLGKAAILVPSPNVAEDHQTHNAMALVQNNAAEFIADKDAKTLLCDKMLELVDDIARQNELAQNIKKMSYPEADMVIAREIIELIDKRKK
ncbi:MAG: undecaprenyldiphospho-muramoylpentapeptide beta-N-acetylglucosaminyltransferase [Marinifilaceae bacterium]